MGYSPERINPGDKCPQGWKRLLKSCQVWMRIAGRHSEGYELVVDAGVFKAESIRVGGKRPRLFENSQRDINIAFMNELSIFLIKGH